LSRSTSAIYLIGKTRNRCGWTHWFFIGGLLDSSRVDGGRAVDADRCSCAGRHPQGARLFFNIHVRLSWPICAEHFGSLPLGLLRTLIWGPVSGLHGSPTPERRRRGLLYIHAAARRSRRWTKVLTPASVMLLTIGSHETR